MDHLVHLFFGGTVNENGALARMRQEGARFDVASSFDDIMCRVNSLFKLEALLYKKVRKSLRPPIQRGHKMSEWS